MKRMAVHGMTMTGWMFEFETDEEIPTRVWNDAASSLDESDSRVLEQTTRVLAVHEAEKRCQMCPVPPPEVKPEPKKAEPEPEKK